VTVTTRRDILTAAGCAALLQALGWPGLALAKVPGDNRLVVVILRGALDGLSAVPPYGDADYRRVRPTIAVPPPGAQGGALDLDGSFGLHPALAPLQPLYREGALLAVNAVGPALGTRSHFDAQDVLENGTGEPGARDGWLNRATAQLGGDRRLGLAAGYTVPLLMRGAAPVRTWSPSILPVADADFLARLAQLYARDARFADTLRTARASAGGGMAAKPGGRAKEFAIMAEAAGKLLAESSGPRIASLEMTGWDTHFNQTQTIQPPLQQLAAGLVALRTSLGAAWSRTVVIAVTEFGRTVAENGSRGTDHGTGTVALLLGGAVRGGRVVGAWPGLAERARFEGRDLKPTTDMRSVFKAALRDHLGLDEAGLEDRVFPGSRQARPMEGLIRRA
jgi:uncharacterized protein (DUF1501 family)